MLEALVVVYTLEFSWVRCHSVFQTQVRTKQYVPVEQASHLSLIEQNPGTDFKMRVEKSR